jgi:hypothetical protein
MPPRKRRWIPLSLRIFGATLVLLGIASGWAGLSIYRQVALRSEIKRLGGWLEMSWVGPDWLHRFVGLELSDKLRRVDGFELSGPNVTDSDVRIVLGGPPIESVGLHDTRITAGGLSNLSMQPGLKGLAITRSAMTDGGLVHVVSLNELVVLNLSRTRVTDEGLARLRPLVKLESLSLDGTSITDRGLKHLSQMPQSLSYGLAGQDARTRIPTILPPG